MLLDFVQRSRCKKNTNVRPKNQHSEKNRLANIINLFMPNAANVGDPRQPIQTQLSIVAATLPQKKAKTTLVTHNGQWIASQC
jgi:hypothetical protein